MDVLNGGVFGFDFVVDFRPFLENAPIGPEMHHLRQMIFTLENDLKS